ncbi:putative ABC transport system permease protein [Colwellia chukchiensis]|uniref:Putative ABC transport system permease protein n=1 Tax=Colwellia chukchiensis TaxID=641665 RepID=A0A1H7MQK2_9GAMM|nr:ABC transporter permease [Colwellia chukchiensis]SEL13570.1 putative ABC transport system permease protein [Colwellia chukchiensis]
MNTSIEILSITDLVVAFMPVIIALGFIYYWSLSLSQASYALARMLVQLLLIGYVLSYIFYADNVWLISSILLLMIAISSWIALRTQSQYRTVLFKYGFVAILSGGGFTLLIISQGALSVSPWYQPQVIIPLAGMIFANAMNSISLCAERLFSEIEHQIPYAVARKHALNAATIPVINGLFAVGLVSLPGMMTGQILSGVSPLIAARYQIVVMCMVFSSAVLSAVVFLMLSERTLISIRENKIVKNRQ